MDLQEKLRRFERDPNWIEVPLPVDPGDQRHEAVLMERLDDDRLRVVSTPGFVENLAAGDVLALDSTKPEGYRLLERGGNLAVRFVLPTEFEARVAEAQVFLEAQLVPLAGHLDSTTGARGATYTIPVAAGFQEVEAVMDRALVLYPGAVWWYGNVYDDDDNPLDWWV